MTKQQWNKIEYGVPEEGDECAVILQNEYCVEGN